jgi:uncharacterized protein DUF2550
VLIALLVVLGVDLMVVIAIAVLVISRKRWLKRQAGVFTGAVRVSSGDVEGLGPKWKRGSGRWVTDVLVWSKAPLLLRSVLIPVDGIAGQRQANAGEVKRLGDDALVAEFKVAGAAIELAARAEDSDRVLSMRAGTS